MHDRATGGWLPWAGLDGWARPNWPAPVRLPLSSLVLHNITRGVFETIVEQAPFAIEDLMNELEAPEEEEGTSEDEPEEDVPSKEPRRGEGHSASGVPAPVLARQASVPAGVPAFASGLVSLFLSLPPAFIRGPAAGLSSRNKHVCFSSPASLSQDAILTPWLLSDLRFLPAHPSSPVPTLHHWAHPDHPV